jgi:hypothetical protein
MLAKIKMPSLAAAVVVSILSAMIMYALGYPAMLIAEVLLILETLKYVVIGGYTALKAIFLGIVVFGLLFALLLPVLILVRRQVQKEQNAPSAASSPTPQPSSDTVERDAAIDAADTFARVTGSEPHLMAEAPDPQADASGERLPHPRSTKSKP